MIRTSLIWRHLILFDEYRAISGISAMDICICNILIPVSYDNVHCDIKVKILRFLNRFLHEFLFLVLAIGLFIFFCNLNI